MAAALETLDAAGGHAETGAVEAAVLQWLRLVPLLLSEDAPEAPHLAPAFFEARLACAYFLLLPLPCCPWRSLQCHHGYDNVTQAVDLFFMSEAWSVHSTACSSAVQVPSSQAVAAATTLASYVAYPAFNPEEEQALAVLAVAALGQASAQLPHVYFTWDLARGLPAGLCHDRHECLLPDLDSSMTHVTAMICSPCCWHTRQK